MTTRRTNRIARGFFQVLAVATVFAAGVLQTGCAAETERSEDEAGRTSEALIPSLCTLTGGWLGGEACTLVFWKTVKEVYMDPKGLTITGKLIQHALLPWAGPYTSADGDVSGKVQTSPEFQAIMKELVASTPPSFDVKGKAVHFASNADLEAAFRNCNLDISGTKAGDKDYTVKVTLNDYYDFKLESIPFDGVKKMLEMIGNDEAALDQMLGYLHPYPIHIPFEFNYELDN